MSSRAKMFCSTPGCGHSKALHSHANGVLAVACVVHGCRCSQYTANGGDPSPELVKVAAAFATSHLRLSIGALRDVEKGENEETGTSAAYWRQKLEAIADLLESDLKDLK